ncbi:transglutaminase domain-containing protein [Clostridium sp. WILCCON 0269]|uniref:Transglutaminase domain-containing protein n=1 Tax=Candidatus Clostridium eludens TaxID=3381663 RepID=A0ABW8SLX8_9CLOT
MFKKICKFMITGMVVILLFSGESCYAAGEYRIWNNSSISAVSSNKIWTITFNRDVDLDSAKNSIKIYEQDTSTPLEVNIINTSSNTVQVSPVSSYVEGKDYVLVVDSSLKSIDGKELTQGVKYNFTVEKNSSQSPADIESYSQYYDAIKSALDNYEDTLILNIGSYDKDTYSLDVINKILIDYPDLRARYLSAASNIEYTSPVKVTINFKYIDTKENLIKKEEAVQEKVDKIISTLITSDMKDYEKELALHDYVVNNTKYDERAYTGNMPEDSYTAYGVLMNGVGVCQGYADAMDRLLIAAGVECRMVIGDANDGNEWIGHAWNIVKIQGEYYQLDSTWDDPVTSDGSDTLSHSYFNITDDQIAKDHRWDRDDYPECTSTKYSFDNLNVTEKDVYGNDIKVADNYNDFYSAVEEALSQGEKSVSVKILNYDSSKYNISQILNTICRKYNISDEITVTTYPDEISGAKYVTIVES